MRPLAIDLFCGLGGWTEGLLAEDYDVIGFDIERHHYGDAKYPAQLVIQDVLTLHGSQFKDAALIVASPPCQAYSYRAMPWKRAKALPPPDNSLFDACFRIQREACEAAGRHIPMVVENVRGAQKWVGRSRWNFGSFHLWGDVPALMPIAKAKVGGIDFSGYGTTGYKAQAFNGTAEKRLREETKNNGGSWFAIGSPGQKETGRNPVHGIVNAEREREREREREYERNGRQLVRRDVCRTQGAVSEQSYNDGQQEQGPQGGISADCKDSVHAVQLHSASLSTDGIKQSGISGMRNNGRGDRWFQDGAARHGSKSHARRAASAMIAKIPLVLSTHIARVYKP